MLFNSNAFLFVFLPLTLLGFHGLRAIGQGKAAFVFLFVASLIFYAWWSGFYALVFIAAIVANFFASRAIARTRSRALTIAAIAGNLLLLGYFKYTNFFIDQLDRMGGLNVPHLDIILPIGVSFYTFIQIAFLADTFVRKAEEPSFTRYGLFVAFFPHMLAGPIVHHKEMMPQFARPLPNRRLQRMLAVGFFLLTVGLAKKVLIADRIAVLANSAFDAAAQGHSPDFFTAWTGVIAYTFQIYFDFSGYSDMAIGLALMFGIRFPANFNSPYKATSLISFWRRWHMTLSRLLRDYVYIPLGGNRHGAGRRHLNLLATMLIGGFWHGAGWTYILWGGAHGLGLAINHIWTQRFGARARAPLLAAAFTFFFVAMAWVLFRAVDLSAAMRIYAALFGAHGLSAPLELFQLARIAHIDLAAMGIAPVADNERTTFYLALLTLIGAAFLAFIAPNSMQLTRRFRPVLDLARVAADWEPRRTLVWRPGWISGAVAGLVFFIAVKAINSAAPSDFLYFQF